MKRLMMGILVVLLGAACGEATSSVEGLTPGGNNTDPGIDDGFLPPPSGSGFKGFVGGASVEQIMVPVGGATVSLLGSASAASATTAADGSYALAAPDGVHWLLATSPGYWGSIDFLLAPEHQAVVPLLRPDDAPSLAAMAAASGGELNPTLGMVEVFVSHGGALPAGLSFTLGSGFGKILRAEDDAYSLVTEIPGDEGGFLTLQLLDVTPGPSTVQVTAPAGMSCEPELPPGATIQIAPKAITALYVNCM